MHWNYVTVKRNWFDEYCHGFTVSIDRKNAKTV